MIGSCVKCVGALALTVSWTVRLHLRYVCSDLLRLLTVSRVLIGSSDVVA